MRTRKHQSPVESSMAGKHKCENGKPPACETQATAAKKAMEATNGFNQHDLAENSITVDHKKGNNKKQKKRRKSPKNKSVVPKEDAMLAGLMAEAVWFDKYSFDKAECAYHCKMAADQAKAPENHKAAKTKRKASEGERRKPAENCSHGNMAACHHVDNGVWLNKFSFDDAESQFVEQFASPLGTRSLNLSLVPHDRRPVMAAQRTPDDGYSSATPTPGTQDRLAINAAVSEPTVNGKPHWATVQGLLADVWLDKSLYDQAETRFYEHISNTPSAPQAQPNFTWGLLPGKKSKRDKYNRKSSGKQQPKKGLPIIMEETTNAIYYPAYFLHGDSEPVWLDKSSCDRAEASFYAAQEVSPAAKLIVSRPPRRVVPRPQHKKKMASPCLTTEKIWLDKYKYDDAERQYYERLSGSTNTPNQMQEDGASTILRDIARARENIQKSLAGSASGSSGSAESGELLARVANLEQENESLHKVVRDLQLTISKLESRVSTLEKASTSDKIAPPTQPVCKLPAPSPGRTLPAPAPLQTKKEEEDDDDDDIDLFGSDDEEEDAEATRIREERLQQYAEKKSKKAVLIAKSSILLDVKPWDDETDMAKLEECVRTVQMDGLLWGSSKLVPVGYGIKKLQIQCVVEDDKVGTDMLEEEITKFEDYVQSVDIAAFNKI